MLSPKIKRNILRILPFGIIWMVLGWVFLFIEYAAIDRESGVPSTAIQINASILVFASISVFFVGLFVGLLEVLFMDRLFRKQSLARKILYKLLIYAILFFLINLIFFPLAASLEMNAGLFEARVWQRYFEYLTSITHFSTNVQLAVSLGLSLFYSEMSENIGIAALLHFFTGKYHRPIEEDRIFMFLDMRSSTSIAEKLGHIKYFNLLKEYYDDLSDPLIQFGGELYQYVGDEMIISWKIKEGTTNNNCIRSFFAMKEALEKQSEKYLRKYGLIPSFKAGLHAGKVTTGEIGVIKKEIFFTGDILNATARIQGLCNANDVDILISGSLNARLELEREYKVRSIGEVELKGKKEILELFTVEK